MFWVHIWPHLTVISYDTITQHITSPDIVDAKPQFHIISDNLVAKQTRCFSPLVSSLETEHIQTDDAVVWYVVYMIPISLNEIQE